MRDKQINIIREQSGLVDHALERSGNRACRKLEYFRSVHAEIALACIDGLLAERVNCPCSGNVQVQRAGAIRTEFKRQDALRICRGFEYNRSRSIAEQDTGCPIRVIERV